MARAKLPTTAGVAFDQPREAPPEPGGAARGRFGKSMDFEALIAKGEHPQGLTAQTVNGTSKANGAGWNKEYQWSSPQVTPEGPWSGNRTGE